MRIYPGTTVDYEFATLGGLGYTGTLNDRQFAALRAEGLTGSLPDMFGQFDGSLEEAGPDYDALMEALLADGSHLALDTSDLTRMWQESTKTTLISADGQGVGAIDSKFGTIVRTFQNGTDVNEPLYDEDGWVTFDGVSDVWGVGTNGASILNNTAAAYLCAHVYVAALPAATGGVVSIGTNVSNVSRFMVQILSDGSISFQLRRLDADVLTTYTSAAGIIIPGTYYMVEADCDFAGTGNARLFVNEELVASGTLAGTPANTSATDSVRARIGQTVANTGGYLSGSLRRITLARKLLTDAERETTRAWASGLFVEGGATRVGVGSRTFFSNPDTIQDSNGNTFFTTAQDDGTFSRHLYWNPATDRASVSAVTPTAAGDDHNQGSLIQLADGSWISASCGHNATSMYIGLGATPFDLTWTNIDVQLGSDEYSYTYLFQLEGLAGDPIILLGRTGTAGGWRIRYSISTDGGTTWSTYTSFLVQDAGANRPYIQAVKNAAGTRIYFASTDGLPSEITPNNIWAGWLDDTGFFDCDDNPVVTPATPSAFTQVFDAAANHNAWVWDLEIIGTDLVLAFTSYPTGVNHRYHRAVMPLATGIWAHEIVVNDAGGLLIAGSANYSGGICCDPSNKDIMYASIEDGSNIYQMNRMNRVSEGVWTATQLTTGSVPSFRPEVSGNVLSFVRGAYGPTYFEFADCKIMGIEI